MLGWSSSLMICTWRGQERERGCLGGGEGIAGWVDEIQMMIIYIHMIHEAHLVAEVRERGLGLDAVQVQRLHRVCVARLQVPHHAHLWVCSLLDCVWFWWGLGGGLVWFYLCVV